MDHDLRKHGGGGAAQEDWSASTQKDVDSAAEGLGDVGEIVEKGWIGGHGKS
jgi:hypothetical protein